jgi:uncharacterized HAD superfamily protein
MVDIDGCLADFIRGYTELGSSMYPGRVQVQETLDREAWHEMNGPHDNAIWAAIKESPDWWATLDPLVEPAVFQTLNELGDRTDLYFVTARVGHSPKAQTERWLESQGVVSPTVIISEKKGEIAQALAAAFCLDDKAGNAVAVSYLARGCKSYLLDRKYNRLDHAVIGGRVKRVNAVADYLADVHAALEE